MSRTPGARILVVDDEPQIRRLLSVSLAGRGYAVDTAGTGQEAEDKVLTEPFDAVLLDLGLPDIDGLDLCRAIRSMSQVPIIVISVRGSDGDKVSALDLGADDYVTKPFSIDELLARIRANLRRATPTPENAVLTIGSLLVDTGARRVTQAGKDVRLTPTEYQLLVVLARSAGRVVTHRMLLREVRGPAYEEDTPLLRVHMVGLRHKLGIQPGHPGYIATEPGVGYRMLDDAVLSE